MKFYPVPDNSKYIGKYPKTGRLLMSLGIILAVVPGIIAVARSHKDSVDDGLKWLGFLGPYPELAVLVGLGFISAILGSMLFIGWGFWAPVKVTKKVSRN